mmetsp:Transcript_155/g.287  ORF Transcript_155/g.287 Transcript_155/m.287 type:complete len:278 (-) Transcript_155:2-835(-)
MGRSLEILSLANQEVLPTQLFRQHGASSSSSTSFMYFGIGSISHTVGKVRSGADRREAALAESAYWDRAAVKRAKKMAYYARRSADNAARAEVDVAGVCDHLRRSLDYVMDRNQACTDCRLPEPNKHSISYEKVENGVVVQKEDHREAEQKCQSEGVGCPVGTSKVRLAANLEDCRRMQYDVHKLRMYLQKAASKAKRARKKAMMAYNSSMNAILDPVLMVKPQTYYAHFYKKGFSGFTKKCKLDCDWSSGMRTRWPEEAPQVSAPLARPKAIWGFI